MLLHRLGRTSVRYAVALFRAEYVSRASDLKNNDFSNDLRMTSQTAAAYGEMTHVFVDPASRRPIEMGKTTREELSKLVVLL